MLITYAIVLIRPHQVFVTLNPFRLNGLSLCQPNTICLLNELCDLYRVTHLVKHVVSKLKGLTRLTK
jgi:hypothetical protein